MPVPMIHTKLSASSSIRSLRCITNTVLMPSTFPTWTHQSSNAHLSQTKMQQWLCQLASVLVVILKITLLDQVSPMNKESKSWPELQRHSNHTLATLLASSTLSMLLLRNNANSLLLITSFSRKEIVSSKLATSIVTGQTVVVSSTTRPRLSLSGLMKKINFASSPCNQVQDSMQSLTVFLVVPLRLKKLSISHTMNILATLPHAQPISVPQWELQSTSNSPSSLKTGPHSKLLLTNSTFKFVVFTENTPNQKTLSTTFLTREDSVAQRKILFKTCTMVLKLWLKLRKHLKPNCESASNEENGR